MIIWGVDNSINGTGLCILTLSDNMQVDNIKLHGFDKRMKYSDGTEIVFSDGNVSVSNLSSSYSRLPYHHKPVYIKNLFCDSYGTPDYVFFEDYAISNGKQSNNLTSVAEFCGGLKECFYNDCIPYITYTPGQIKLFATNNGNADKVMMGDAFSSALELKYVNSDKYFRLKKYESPRADMVDAFWIAVLGRCHIMIKNNEHEVLRTLGTKKAEMFRPKKQKPNKMALADWPFIRKGEK